MENFKDELKMVFDNHEKAQGVPDKTINTPEMIRVNDKALKEAEKSEFSHYAFKRDIFNKAEDLFGASSCGFVQEVDHCLGYSAMKGKVEKVSVNDDDSLSQTSEMRRPVVNELNVHENITKKQVKKDILALLVEAMPTVPKTKEYINTTHGISPADLEKVDAFKSFVEDLDKDSDK